MPTFVKNVCHHCTSEYDIYIGYVNQAKKKGLKMFCSRICFGLDRRINRSEEEKKAIKAAYDVAYNKLNEEKRKKQRHEWFVKDYAANPEKHKEIRRKKYPKHLEYLNNPEYKAWKKDYDERYRAAKLYGEFAEAAIILKKLETELDSKIIKYASNITQNKSTQKRKRAWQRLQKLQTN